jgi:hypothetical protein
VSDEVLIVFILNSLGKSHAQLWRNGQPSKDLPADLYNTEEINLWKEWAKKEGFAGEFHQSVIEYNKEFSFVSKSLGKPLGYCLWYYYNTYKPSDNYQLLKAHLRKLQLEQSRNRDECTICDDGGGKNLRPFLVVADVSALIFYLPFNI